MVEGQTGLISSQPHGDRGHGPVSVQGLTREIHQQSCSDRAKKVANVNDRPGAQHLGELHSPGGPRHDHQGVAREELGSSDDDQNEPETEYNAGEQPADPIRHYAIGAGQHSCREHGPERDKGSSQYGKCEKRRGTHADLLRADVLRRLGDLGRKECIDPATVRS